MPLYEYTCTVCHDEFELLVRNGDAPTCPKCGGEKLNKRFSVPAAHTKNGGSLPIAGPSSMSGLGADGTCGAPSCCRGRCMS